MEVFIDSSEGSMGLIVGVMRFLFLYTVVLVLPVIVASQPSLPPTTPLPQEAGPHVQVRRPAWHRAPSVYSGTEQWSCRTLYE
jgi:hypothetical protein